MSFRFPNRNSPNLWHSRQVRWWSLMSSNNTRPSWWKCCPRISETCFTSSLRKSPKKKTQIQVLKRISLTVTSWKSAYTVSSWKDETYLELSLETPHHEPQMGSFWLILRLFTAMNKSKIGEFYRGTWSLPWIFTTNKGHRVDFSWCNPSHNRCSWIDPAPSPRSSNSSEGFGDGVHGVTGTVFWGISP